LLFLTYINDIGEKLLSLSRLFADDTSLGYSSQNVVEIENVINHDLCELNTWSTKWLMPSENACCPNKNNDMINIFFIIISPI
jgi:hypothetical protein